MIPSNPFSNNSSWTKPSSEGSHKKRIKKTNSTLARVTDQFQQISFKSISTSGHPTPLLTHHTLVVLPLNKKKTT